MKIGIDARFYGSIGKGLGRYTEKLVRYLEKIASPEDEFFVFLRSENFDDYEPSIPNFRKVLADYRWYGFGEQFLFPVFLSRFRLDLVHFPHFNVPVPYRRPFVVTIHDLILLRFPTVRNTAGSRLVYRFKYRAYRFVIASAVRRAKAVLTVSDFVRRDMAAIFPESEAKTVVGYEGCDFPTSPREADSESSRNRGILKPYFLYVGSAYPHKNLEAFIPLSRRFPDVRFVLIGKHDYFYRRLMREVSDAGVENIVFPGFVPDAELSEWYEDATGYVFPSLHEGFGLPPLEAMSLGTPVIAADRGSLPEILGDAALFFDPDDGDDLAEKVGQVLRDRDTADSLSRKGKERVSEFRWEKTAEVTMKTYRSVLGEEY
jgi:glycosyltransferase involved in cell wall biosynthesis